MRALATLETIRKVEEHGNADRLEVATVRGWQVVTKKGEFSEGSRCVYFEIDSLLPLEERYEFLRAYAYHKGTEKYRIRTAKLRGVVSQGLVMPLEQFPELDPTLPDGSDVTLDLGIMRFDPPVPVQLRGVARKFSWPIPKTDEERMENLPESFFEEHRDDDYYVTVKMDGTSATFVGSAPNDDTFHVCSRNLSLEDSPGNLYWQIERMYKIREAIEGKNIAIQGEVCGQGIQGNPCGMEGVALFVFNLYSYGPYGYRRVAFDDMIGFAGMLAGLFPPRGRGAPPTVPILYKTERYPLESDGKGEPLSREFIRHLVNEARYDQLFPTAKKKIAEGVVVRAKDQSWSFKYVNPEYLL